MATIRTLLAAIILGSACAPAAAADRWTPTSWGGEEGDKQIFFVNRSSISPRGKRLQLEATMVRQKPTEGGVTRALERSLVDCSTRASATIWVRLYDRHGRQLFLIKGDGTFEDYVEGSAWRILVDTVCDGTFPPIQAADPKSYAESEFRG